MSNAPSARKKIQKKKYKNRKLRNRILNKLKTDM